MITITKDGIPYIYADNKSVVFGDGEGSVEYTWDELSKIIFCVQMLGGDK